MLRFCAYAALTRVKFTSDAFDLKQQGLMKNTNVNRWRYQKVFGEDLANKSSRRMERRVSGITLEILGRLRLFLQKWLLHYNFWWFFGWGTPRLVHADRSVNAVFPCLSCKHANETQTAQDTWAECSRRRRWFGKTQQAHETFCTFSSDWKTTKCASNGRSNFSNLKCE